MVGQPHPQSCVLEGRGDVPVLHCIRLFDAAALKSNLPEYVPVRSSHGRRPRHFLPPHSAKFP